MRIRSIKPDFWTDEKMSALHPETVLLAIGLQNCADDEGFFNANWRLLQASVFPLRDLSRKVPVMLHELSKAGYLTYVGTADGRVLGRLNTFADMQVISHAKKSTLRTVFEASLKSPVALPEGSGLIPAGLEGKGMEGKGVGVDLGGGGGKGDGTSPDGDGTPIDALKIYQAYPRKQDRPAALRAINKILTRKPDEPGWCLASHLLERTQAFALAVSRWPADFRYTRGGADTVPHPATWFNGERFEDDPATWQPGKISVGGRGAAAEPFDPTKPNAHTGGMTIVNPPAADAATGQSDQPAA